MDFWTTSACVGAACGAYAIWKAINNNHNTNEITNEICPSCLEYPCVCNDSACLCQFCGRYSTSYKLNNLCFHCGRKHCPPNKIGNENFNKKHLDETEDIRNAYQAAGRSVPPPIVTRVPESEHCNLKFNETTNCTDPHSKAVYTKDKNAPCTGNEKVNCQTKPIPYKNINTRTGEVTEGVGRLNVCYECQPDKTMKAVHMEGPVNE